MASGFRRRATRLASGTASLSSSRNLPIKVGKSDRKPRNVTARPRQASDEALFYRITNSSENDRDSRRRPLGGHGGECASSGQDDIDLEHNQFGRERGEPLGVPLRPAIMDSHALTLGVTGFAQSLTERGQGHLRVGRSDTEVADHWHSRLLRAHCEWPYSRRAADCADQPDNELPPPHSITSSARARSV